MSFDHGGAIYAAARSLGCGSSEILDLSASINPLGLSAEARSACLQALDQVPHYPDPAAGLLVEALSTHYEVPVECVVPANGSTSLIHLLPGVVSGSRALVVAPAFSEYTNALNRHGWQVGYHLLLPEDGFALDMDRLARRIHAERPALLFFCTPGNPSGLLYGPELVASVLSICEENGTLLALDEAFMDFCGDQQSARKMVVASGQGVVLRSLTKFYALAGLRLGCALAAPELAQRLRDRLPPWEVNSLAQAAGIAALNDRQYALKTLELVRHERQLLTDTLSRLPHMSVFPSAVNYLLIRLDGDWNSASLCRQLLTKHRIMARDCANFTGLSNRFIRVAVRTRHENERLMDALKKELCP